MYNPGDIVDDMTIIAYEGKTSNFIKLYKIKCNVCGKEKIIQQSRLNRHETTTHNNKSCFYIQSKDNYIGLCINDYTIIKKINRKYRTESYYLAKCNICGITFETLISNFKKGYGTKHSNCTKHIPQSPYLKRFRKIYSCMRYRTTNPKYPEWYLYGGRGINSDYYQDFITFYKDLFTSYVNHVKKYGEKDTSLDRINPNGNYCFNNVRWATCKEQANNKRGNY